MNVQISYCIYELNRVMNSDKHLALEKVDLGSINNSFETEQEAIQTLIDKEATYVNYVILKEIFIDNF